MARKRTLGYVQLEWTCPNCNSRNPGGKKTCENCGAPQPENVQFQRAVEEKILRDEKAIQAAAAGADIHCGFCGTRNPVTASNCSQCGAELKEGKARQSGAVLQAAAPVVTVICTNCGTENPGTKTMCQKCGSPLPRPQQPAAAPVGVSASAPRITPAAPINPPAKPAKKIPWLLIGGICAALLICCVAAIFMFFVPTSSVEGTVANVYWQTTVPLQEEREVRYNNEPGSAPSDAYDVSCRTESREVCEVKTIDRGNGFAEQVEECHDESTDYCSYTRQEWQTIQDYTQEGYTLYPVYASPNVSFGQRTGSASEDLTVYFDTEKGQITYSPDSVTEFQQFEPGSTWTLKMNALGSVVSVAP